MGSEVLALLIFLGICLLACLFHATVEYFEEKDNTKRKIEDYKRVVTKGFDEIESSSKIFGEEYAKTLLEIANKMDKIVGSDIKEDIKPYDMIGRTDLNKSGRKWGMIVIDKNLNPRFVASTLYSNDGEDVMNIQLEAALDSKGVRELAEKCRKNKLDVDIEKFRKKKIENFINN